MSDKLSFLEWTFIATTCGAMLGIGIASSPPLIEEEEVFNNPTVDVFVVGSVNKPGRYQVQSEMTVEQAIAFAEPKKCAKIDKLNLNSQVRPGQIIKVPKIRKKGKKINSSIVEKSQV